MTLTETRNTIQYHQLGRSHILLPSHGRWTYLFLCLFASYKLVVESCHYIPVSMDFISPCTAWP